MRRGREFFGIEVETLSGTEIDPLLFFTVEKARLHSAELMKREDALGVTIFTLKTMKNASIVKGV